MNISRLSLIFSILLLFILFFYLNNQKEIKVYDKGIIKKLDENTIVFFEGQIISFEKEERYYKFELDNEIEFYSENKIEKKYIKARGKIKKYFERKEIFLLEIKE